jgi:hypothetical protein
MSKIKDIPTAEKHCGNCGHKVDSYGGKLCNGDIVVKPVETVSHFHGRCGLDRRLWIPIKTVKK